MTLEDDLKAALKKARLLESRIQGLENTLRDCADVLDDYSDSEDGDYGIPVPNKPMAMRTEVLRVLKED